MGGSLKRNFFYNSIYQILVLVLPFVTTPYLSRVFGAERIGEYSYTYAFAYYFVLAAMLGVNNYGNRSCARIRDDKKQLSKTFCEIFALQFVLGLFFTASFLVFSLVYFKGNIRTIAIIQTLYVLSSAFDINWLFFGLEEFKITIGRNLLLKIVTLIAIFLFVKDESDILLYTAIMSVSVLISQLVVWPFAWKRIDFVKPSIRKIISHLKPNVILFIPAIAVSIYKYMDKIMIGSLSNMEQEGFYTQSEKILQIPLGFISALGNVMLPRMSNLAYHNEVQKSRLLIQKSMLFVAFLSSAMSWGLAAIADIFIPLFLGNGYADCILILQGLSITVPFVAWANVIRTQYLIPNKKDKVYLVTVGIGALINLIINALLIKQYGALGAVIGTIGAEGAVALSQTFLVRKEIDVRNYLLDSLPFFFIGAVMFVLVKMINVNIGTFGDLICKIVIGGTFYCIASLLAIRVCHKTLYLEIIKKMKTVVHRKT